MLQENNVFRLYLVNRTNEKCTGKKRDYASKSIFLKYGIETYERYNKEFYYKDKPTNLKAKLCFLNKHNKWQKLNDLELKELGL